MIVKLHDKLHTPPDLTTGELYVVLGIEADDYRILNDHGQPYLYPYTLFEVVDKQEPADRVTEIGEDTERYAYPPAFNQAGFFESYFDSEQRAVTTFWRVVNQRLVATAAAA